VFALLRKTKLVEPSVAEVAARRVREGAVPILRAQPGFLLHLGFLSEGCEAVGISLFDDRAAAHTASGRLREWAAANMADLTQGEPEVCSGTVLDHRGPGPSRIGSVEDAVFVTVREYRGVGSSEAALSLLSEHILAVMERHSGFRGVWVFGDEREPEHAVGVSLWANRGAAFAAHERVLEIMATLRDVFPTLPRITAGAARVIVGRPE
jgi:hypothetical protein